MNKKNLFIVSALMIFALMISLTLGHPGLNITKIAGIFLAFVAFLPVFIALKRTLGVIEPEKFLAIFVGGFFFKSIIVLVGIWYAISRIGLDKIDFAISVLAFILVLQIFESIYFLGLRGGNS